MRRADVLRVYERVRRAVHGPGAPPAAAAAKAKAKAKAELAPAAASDAGPGPSPPASAGSGTGAGASSAATRRPAPPPPLAGVRLPALVGRDARFTVNGLCLVFFAARLGEVGTKAELVRFLQAMRCRTTDPQVLADVLQSASATAHRVLARRCAPLTGSYRSPEHLGWDRRARASALPAASHSRGCGGLVIAPQPHLIPWPVKCMHGFALQRVTRARARLG